MPLDPAHIQDLLATPDLKLQESLVSDVVSVNNLVSELETQLKEAKLLRQRRLLIAFEAGVRQAVLAQVLNVKPQHISRLVLEYKLILGIPEGVTLEEHEARLAFVRDSTP